MFRWAVKPNSVARGILVVITIYLGSVTLVLLPLGQPAHAVINRYVFYVGLFLGLICTRLFYRRPNPIAAAVDIFKDLGLPLSRERGWLMGIAAASLILAVCWELLPAMFLPRHGWLAWGPIIVGAIFGHASYAEPNVLRSGWLGLRRTLIATAVIACVLLVISVAVATYYGLAALLTRYGMLGIIAVLLLVIVFQLHRLSRHRW